MVLLDFPPWIQSLLLAPFGLVLGSFCNVLIHRLPQEKPEDRNVVTRPSACPSCKTRIKPWHNVPLFGWLWLRGKCAACGWRIPVRYPLVELLGGLILGGTHYFFPFGSLIHLKAVLCAFALLVLFFTDWTEFILPDVLQYPLMGLGLLFTLPQLCWPGVSHKVWGLGDHLMFVDTWVNGLQPAPCWNLLGPSLDWKGSLLGIVLGYGVLYGLERAYVWLRNLVARRLGKEPIEAGMGMGDFKMLAWLGAFWGWKTMLGILWGGVVLAGVVSIPLLLLRKADGRTMLPFGCALALATPLVVFFGPFFWNWFLAVGP